MKVLITGASGFLGKNQLLHCQTSWDMTAVYSQNHEFPAWVKQQGLSHIRCLRCDLTQPEEVKTKLKDFFDVVIHFAANGDPAFAETHPLEDLQKNTLTTINLLREGSFQRFVYFSSGAVYDGCKGKVTPQTTINPKLNYAISNLASERYIASLAKGRETVIVRFFGAYGPFEPERKIFTKLVRSLALEKQSIFTVHGNGSNLIDAMYVVDACEAVKRIAEMPTREPIIDVGCGNPLTISQLVEQVGEIFQQKVEIHHEGHVPEYIQFYMDPKPLQTLYQFSPKTTLKTGLLELKKYLVHVPSF